MKSHTEYTCGNAFNNVWVYKLVAEYKEIAELAYRNLRKHLVMPQFSIDVDMGMKWGEWVPGIRLIRLNAILFRKYEWEAVRRVLKHEVGHQIVSEVFGFNGHGCSHGEHWKLACNAIGLVYPTRCDSPSFMEGLKTIVETTMTDKVRKLLVKGTDGSVTKEEAELFLNKAQELMMRHEITMKDITGTDRLWLKRPVGESYVRWPHWVWDVANLLTTFYSVKSIRSYHYVNGRLRYHLELLGEPDNLDIAEYVFYAIVNNGKELFEKALTEHREKCKSDVGYRSNFADYSGRLGRFTFASFMRGLVKGFKEKLYSQQDIIEDKINHETDGSYSVVAMSNKKLLDEMYDKAYPNSRKLSGVRYSSRSSAAGRAAGQNLSLNQAVRNGNNGIYLR